MKCRSWSAAVSLLLLTASLIAQPSPQAPPPGYAYEDDMLLPIDVVYGESAFEATPWPVGWVYYVFDASTSGSNQTQLLNCMAEISGVAAVTFWPRTTQANYIIFKAATVNNSPVGMMGGAQDLNITSWGSKYIIIHEMFHALGYLHEQSRSDRDTFVTINGGNIQNGQAHNFNIHGASQNLTGYDFLSIMHYDQCAFSNGCPAGTTCNCVAHTIDCKPAYASFQTLIGNRTYMSLTDAQGLQARYGTPYLWPQLTSMSPTLVYTSTGTFQLEVYGSNFYSASPNASGVQGTRVLWNGGALPTTYVDTGHVRATVSASLIANPGTATITVQNPSPGAGNALSNLTITIACPPNLVSLTPFAPQTVTNPCSTFSITPAGNTFNVVAVSSPSDWDITIGGVSAAAAGSTGDVVAGSGFLGAGTVTPTTGSIIRYLGAQAATAEFVTSAPVTVGTPIIDSIPPGSIVRAYHINQNSLGYYNLSTAGDPSLRYYLIWKGNNIGFQWVSSASPNFSGWIGGPMNYSFAMLPGPYTLIVCRNGGPTTASSDFTLNVCLSANNVALTQNVNPTPLLGASGGFCYPFSFTPYAGHWNCVGVSSSSDWDISVGAAVSQQGGSNCDYVIANGHNGTVTPASGTSAQYSGAGTGYVHYGPLATAPSFPGFWYTYTNMMATFEFNVTAAANYNVAVDGGPGTLWDLHAPGSNSAWRRKVDRQAGGFSANATAQTLSLSTGWHAIVFYRNGGVSPTLLQPTFYATLSATQPPTLTGISPASAPAGSGTFTMTVNGASFIAASAVRWNGSPLPTTLVSATELQATVDGSLLLAPGVANVQVFTPGPFGGLSGGTGFQIENSVPAITMLTPGNLPAGSPSTGFTVDGTGFVPGAEVRWSGAPLVTGFVSGTQLTANVGFSFLLAAGTFDVTVFNPAPGGGESGAYPVQVSAPAISGLSPATIPVQTPIAGATSVTIQGTSFVPGTSVVSANGVPLTPTLATSTSLTVLLTPSAILQMQRPGAVAITVQNSAAVVSNTMAFIVGSGTNAGTIRRQPLAPAPGTAYAAVLEGGNPFGTVTMVVDLSNPAPVAPWPSAAANLVLAVSVPPNVIPLVDGFGLFSPASGATLDAAGGLVLPGFVLPNPMVNFVLTVQAVYLDPAAVLGFNLTWARFPDIL